VGDLKKITKQIEEIVLDGKQGKRFSAESFSAASSELAEDDVVNDLD